MTTLTLPNYDIHLGDDWAPFRRLLAGRAPSSVLVIVDDHTRRHCWPHLRREGGLEDATLINIPPGEQHKNLDTCRHIWQSMLEAGADRRALVINLGGGVVGDMGGFCAATFKRGLDFVQMPTTLLSQVDASIGGKLGIDFGDVKNSVGLFADPQAVFIRPAFLETLPPRELRSGFAEIIKHALIADAGQWEQLRRLSSLEGVDWRVFLAPSLRIKRAIVEQDPYEQGLRKALNFGHTIGHAVEGHSLETGRPLLHGEAVAVGMIAEAWLSHHRSGLPAADLEVVTGFLLGIFGQVALSPDDYPRYLELMRNDKKNEGGQILFSLIAALGEASINQACTDEEIMAALDYYRMARPGG